MARDSLLAGYKTCAISLLFFSVCNRNFEQAHTFRIFLNNNMLSGHSSKYLNNASKLSLHNCLEELPRRFELIWNNRFIHFLSSMTVLVYFYKHC